MGPIVALVCPECGCTSKLKDKDIEILETFLKHEMAVGGDFDCPYCQNEIHVYFDRDHLSQLLDHPLKQVYAYM